MENKIFFHGKENKVVFFPVGELGGTGSCGQLWGLSTTGADLPWTWPFQLCLQLQSGFICFNFISLMWFLFVFWITLRIEPRSAVCVPGKCHAKLNYPAPIYNKFVIAADFIPLVLI